MTTRVMTAAMLCIAALVTSWATPAQARREWQAFGGRGDASTKVECPVGQVMVGFEGHAGVWIDQLRVMCAPLTDDFQTGPARGIGGYFGGRGGGPVQALCPRSTVMTKIGFRLTPDKGKVAVIVLGCISASGEVGYASYSAAAASFERCAKVLGVIPAPCDLTKSERVQTCPQEQFVGLTVRSGLDVNAIGVICDRRDPPPPPVAAAPVNPVAGRPPIITRRPRPKPAAELPPIITRRPAVERAAVGVTVKLDVDVYAAPGGEGPAVASLGAGTAGVTLVGACKGDWCHVRWSGGDGWVYSGSDYNSLGR